MTTFMRSAVFGFASLAVMPIVPAYAGFDFVPPAQQQATVVPAPVANAPVPPVQPVDIAPIAPQLNDIAIIPDAPVTNANAKPIPVTPAAPAVVSVPPVVDAPVKPAAAAPVKITPAASAPAADPAPVMNTKLAVYPPPGNRPSVPLSGTKKPEPVIVMPAPSRLENEKTQAKKVPVTKADDVVWNAVPAVDAQSMGEAAQANEKVLIAKTSPAPANNKPSQQIAAIDGFGNNIPFSLAMEQVVPATFNVKYLDQPDPNMIVSWSGGRPWTKVVEDMIYAHGFRIKVVNNTAMIFKPGNAAALTLDAQAVQPVATAKPVAATVSAPVAKQSAPVADVAVVPSAPVPAPVKPAQEIEGVPVSLDEPTPVPVASAPEAKGYNAARIALFSASAGDTLQSVLGRWSDDAFVQLYWRADRDFKLDRAVSYNTTYARAVERLISEYRGQPGYPVASLHPNAPEGPAVLDVQNVQTDAFSVR